MTNLKFMDIIGLRAGKNIFMNFKIGEPDDSGSTAGASSRRISP
jgi:hypothetical protein